MGKGGGVLGGGHSKGARRRAFVLGLGPGEERGVGVVVVVVVAGGGRKTRKRLGCCYWFY